jgi:serine/threonine-protein kinase HipA
MSICPITYEPTSERYSLKGIRRLSRSLTQLRDLPFTATEQLSEAAARADKISIAGAQPKLSARFDARAATFVLVDEGADFILKPPNPLFPELPQNEDLTMRLAALAKIEVPFHGLVYAKDSSLTYFIKRFDRGARGAKLAVEDFAQLSGSSRDTKYDSSMERVVRVIRTHATFPALECLKLFRQTLFCFLVGNEDMHLKNFSLVTRRGKVELSPAYDLVNSTIAIGRPQEELALPLNGKKRNLTRNDLVRYFAGERMALEQKVVTKTLDQMARAAGAFPELIARSFLPEAKKERYVELLESRCKRLFG